MLVRSLCRCSSCYGVLGSQGSSCSGLSRPEKTIASTTSATSSSHSSASGYSRCSGCVGPQCLSCLHISRSNTFTQVWTVSLPVTILNSPNVTKFQQPDFGTGRDIAGIILFAIGFLLESISDIQKYRFRSNPENKGKVCDIGLFVWTRHPNYFGEIIIHFGKPIHSFL